MERREIARAAALGFANPYRSLRSDGQEKDLNTTGRWLRRFTQTWPASRRTARSCVAVLREARERGLIDADALAMLEGVLEVADLQVRDIMVPRAQMVCRAARRAGGAHPARWWSSRGHSRFPVMDEDRDDIVGILLAKDLLRLHRGRRRTSASTSASSCARRCSCPSPSA